MDYNKINVLLIGTSTYNDSNIKPIPNVEQNLKELKNVFSNNNIFGLPESNIIQVLNADVTKIKIAIGSISNRARGKDQILIVYYAGHGLMSSKNSNVYITAIDTLENHLELTGLSLDELKNIIKDSTAGQKIIILDCCHSGNIFGNMGALQSKVIENIKRFDDREAFLGTYILTATDERQSAKFNPDDPTLPTLFTQKLVEVFNEGIMNNKPYYSFQEVHGYLSAMFKAEANPEFPIPQHAIFGDGGRISIIKNRKQNLDEIAWFNTKQVDAIEEYYNFIQSFPNSKFISEAEQKIALLEEEARWSRAKKIDTITSYREYIISFSNGKFVDEAKDKISFLIEELKKNQEEALWSKAENSNIITLYEDYLSKYPSGKYSLEAKKIIKTNQEKKQEESLWREVDNREIPNIQLYQKYIEVHPEGIHAEEALQKIGKLESIEIQKRQEEAIWKNAIQENNAHALDKYIQMYPNGIYISEAQERISQLEELEEQRRKQEEAVWQNATSTNVLKLYQNYVDKYPTGRYIQHAQDKILELKQIEEQKKLTREKEEIFWQKVDQENTIFSYEEYLRVYPIGFYSDNAKARITKIKQVEEQKILDAKIKEKVAWQKIVEVNSINLFKDYLKEYPNGNFFKEAQEKIIQLEQLDEQIRQQENDKKQEEAIWQNAAGKDVLKLYRSYVKRYPSGIYTKKAQERITQLEQLEEQIRQQETDKKQEEAVWQNAVNEDKVKLYKGYIEKYPNSKHTSYAKDRISQLMQIEETKNKDENHVWQIAVKEDSIKVYQSYIEKYPRGQYVNDAEKRIKELGKEKYAWKNASEKNTLYSYKEYLERYPNGQYMKEAVKMIEKFEAEKIRLEAIQNEQYRKKREKEYKSMRKVGFEFDSEKIPQLLVGLFILGLLIFRLIRYYFY
ncbi:hypothetical protein GXP67_19595 [Rhodocytophaga rosea]|uniref:Peptidase C14 caspase domain-containing protein n=1 Tax=Rhodocytophaga rosea TaxID=2704465 RepID=A0A6C0GM28_9BACT|nr:caspase family protein [Rhodocytophaga rosea]QHT68690.1 hypothetical protein GXP67_19595 [Rhodocytophaga rosea]